MAYEGYGYGTSGASVTKRATKGLTGISGSPQQDIDFNNYTMRQRGRLMYMSNAVAASAINTHRTNTIGVGLIPNPRPDIAYLGLSDEQGAEWVRTVKREFGLWANEKRSCDASGINNFYEMQQMLLQSWLMSGDVFVLVQQREKTFKYPYTLRLRAIEADRIMTPSATTNGLSLQITTGVNPDNGNMIYDGVEVDASGMPIAYHINNRYPNDYTIAEENIQRVEIEGKNTGLPNILHIMTAHRPEQYRGVSYLAPVIIPLLQLGRFTEAELAAAVVNAFFTVYVTSDTDGNPLNETYGDDQSERSDSKNEYEMGPGQVNFLKPGENVTPVKAEHPSASFGDFTEAICSQVGAALEIPKDILLKQFDRSYSASRGALLEAWKSFKTYRQWFVNDFCNPVYELFMCEAVSSGRIQAPGFFADPATRSAWLKAQWIGPAQGQLDPVKEINAEILAIQNGLTTRSDAALRVNGSDFAANIEQLAREQGAMDAAGIITGSVEDINVEESETEDIEDE